MTPDEYCQQKTAASGSSFYYSFLFLPSGKRRAITALYAFCREVDDVVDECRDPHLARAKLDWWREEVAALFEGEPRHPVALALQEVVRRYDLPRQYFDDIIDGMAMDLAHAGYGDFKALQRYCYRVAGVVGLMAAEVFGYQDRRTLNYAGDLGIACQLTNIIRDVGEDARRGRVYLPVDEQERFGVRNADILAGRDNEALRRLIEFQVERAEQFYQQALAALPAADRKAQRAGLVMAAIYRTLLQEIRRDGCRVLDRRVALTPVRKLWIAWRTWIAG